jgi:DNA-binding transcriptional regulator YbjK
LLHTALASGRSECIRDSGFSAVTKRTIAAEAAPTGTDLASGRSEFIRDSGFSAVAKRTIAAEAAPTGCAARIISISAIVRRSEFIRDRDTGKNHRG